MYQFSFAHSTKGPTYTHIPLAHPWLAPRVGGHTPTEDPTASLSTFRRGRGAPKVLGDGHRPFPRVCPGQPEALGLVTRSLPPLTPHKSESTHRAQKYRNYACVVRGNPPDDFQMCGNPCLEPPPCLESTPVWSAQSFVARTRGSRRPVRDRSVYACVLKYND